MRASTFSALFVAFGLAQSTVTRHIACHDIKPPSIPGAKVITFSATEQYNISGISVDEAKGLLNFVSGLNICAVEVALTHPGVGDKVGFQIWLPLRGWNKRFIARGGGGYIAGTPGTLGLGSYVEQGFAVGTTDGGNIANSIGNLLPDMVQSSGVIDLGRFADFSSRALHELAVIGKAVTKSFYARPPSYSYWHGCSTGGRQGYMIAQEYPDDFDGILANAPALNFPSLLMGLSWAQFTMRRLNHEVSSCVFDEFYRGAIRECDGLDGVIDGIISNPKSCSFDPFSIVGLQVPCGLSHETVNAQDAEVLTIIMGGPKSSRGTPLFYEWEWGMNYTFIDPDMPSPDSRTLWDNWISILINKNPSFDMNTFKEMDQMVDYFEISHIEYDAFIATNKPDLSAFRNRGGKLLTWHGLADGAIPPDNTISYRERVEAVMGGNQNVNQFYRLFLAPGIGHCAGGPGAFPADALDSLIEWVEKDDAPTELHGTASSTRERKICLYPQVAQYDGQGNPDDAGSYTCAAKYTSADSN
ncbi:Tannase/feruloyl esterase [Aspergillus pseudodeflectus]|uniref:Carboxylic ester hydrolase n=1 Tax=Aspergillus pseudodeflectus TaxID=176178 RepID=A0ABR4J7G0_9EURO